MLFRAIFWIAVVAFFMPQGQKAQPGVAQCQHLGCSAGKELLAHIRTSGLQSLIVVRSQIEDAERARKRG